MNHTRPDAKARNFRVYVTSDIDLESLPALLACEWSRDGRKGYDVQLVQGTAQEICRLHEQTAPAGGLVYTKLFLLIDPHPKVLAVNLKPKHGYRDAIRVDFDGCGNVVASLSIGNTSWEEHRCDSTAFMAYHRFALYDLVHDQRFDTAFKSMDDGMLFVNVRDGVFDPEPRGRGKHHYIACQGDSLEGIIATHTERAGTQLDAGKFAVVDKKFRELGALIVQMSPKDMFRCKKPAAGEILYWLHIQFMTWEEAKHLAEQSNHHFSSLVEPAAGATGNVSEEES